MSTQPAEIPPQCDAAELLALPDLNRAVTLAATFKALADPTRVRLLGYIARAPEGTACDCNLPELLGISQPTLSHHLRKLVDAGLVAREQRGRWAHFTAVDGALEPARRFMGAPDEE